MLIVYAITIGIPRQAMISMILRVLADEAALYMSRLLAATGFDKITLGYMPRPNNASRAAMAAHDDKKARKTLVESLLWGVKLHGCAISRRELDQLVSLEIKG